MDVNFNVHKISIAKPPLVYVWLGDKLPSWARQAFEISSKLCEVDTILLCSNKISKLSALTMQIALEEFYIPKVENICLVNNTDVDFRNGFWNKTTERFLVLQQFQVKYQVKSFFHAELDNIVFDISKLAGQLDQYGVGCFVPRDRVDRGIASLIYINSNTPLENIISVLNQSPPPAQNDMQLLGMMLQNDANFMALPTDHSLAEDGKNNKWSAVPLHFTNGLFDAAAIGQFLFGIDFRNSNSLHYNAFVNENTGYDLWQIYFNWPSVASGLQLIRKSDGQSFNLYNLHVHSKLFNLIAQEEKLQYILYRINNHQRSLLKINFWQNRLFKSIAIRFHSVLKLVSRSK